MSVETLQKKREEKKGTSLEDLRSNFEKEKAKTVNKPKDRKVTLIYKSCCGCGCSDVRLERVVPYDSPLKNGDRVKTYENSDKVID